jgi:hypothetical protein
MKNGPERCWKHRPTLTARTLEVRMAAADLFSNSAPINERGQFVRRHIDLPIGATFGRLAVLGDERRERKQYTVSCRCDCGREIRCRVDSLRIGKKLQCGDHRRVRTDGMRRAMSLRNRTHGRSRTTEYNSWIGMKMRCFNRDDARFADYGGRGITVCERWRHSFEAFLRDLGTKPSPAHSLDRIDVDGNYEPGNVRWADASLQTKNRRPFLMRSGTGKRLTPTPPLPAYIPPPPLPENAHHNTRHGMSGTPEYYAWKSMKERCLDPAHHAYRNYGGRGVTVCASWQESFTAFLADVGMRPPGRYSLDRIDNERGYGPGNVRWADSRTQNRNRRPFVIVARNRTPA